jgi:hypothetical protein
VISANLLSDDRLELDNIRTHVFDVVTEMKVLIVEGERGMSRLQGSAGLLDLALAPPAEANESGVRSNSYVQTELISDLELGNKVLGDYRAVILGGRRSDPAERRAATRAFREARRRAPAVHGRAGEQRQLQRPTVPARVAARPADQAREVAR